MRCTCQRFTVIEYRLQSINQIGIYIAPKPKETVLRRWNINNANIQRKQYKYKAKVIDCKQFGINVVSTVSWKSQLMWRPWWNQEGGSTGEEHNKRKIGRQKWILISILWSSWNQCQNCAQLKLVRTKCYHTCRDVFWYQTHSFKLDGEYTGWSKCVFYRENNSMTEEHWSTKAWLCNFF